MASSGGARLFVGLLILGGLVAGVIVVVQSFRQKQDRLAELEKHIPELMKVRPNGEAKDAPYLTGRLVVIDAGTQEIEDVVYYDLPPNLRARNGAEVGTVVLLTWEMKPYINPNTKQPEGDCDVCQLAALDRATGLVTARKTIAGRPGMPNVVAPKYRPRLATQPTRGASARPYQDVADYLAGLPRR